MKFVVRDVTPENILVEFENKTKALVPIENGWDRTRIEEEISKYITVVPERPAYRDVADIPMKVGYNNDIESFSDKNKRMVEEKEENMIREQKKIEAANKKREELYQNQKVSYKAVRRAKYPSIEEQLDSLYHAGIFPEEMANRIKNVKDTYPKDMEKITQKELQKIQEDESMIKITVDGEELIMPKYMVEDYE